MSTIRECKVNGIPFDLNKEDNLIEIQKLLKRKDHYVLCECTLLSNFFFLTPKRCVKLPSGLDPGVQYISMPSEDMAHRVHLEKLRNGVLDLQPLERPLTIAAAIFGVATTVAATTFGVAALVKAWKQS